MLARLAHRGAAVLAVALTLLTPAWATAQPSSGGRGPDGRPPVAGVDATQPQPGRSVRVFGDDESAAQTRERLRNILRQHPPTLAEVLRLDPSPMKDEGYLTPYPALHAFLAEHPEIARNPSFFVGENWFNWDRNTPAARRVELIGGLFAGLAILVGGLTFLFTLGWVIRMPAFSAHVPGSVPPAFRR